MHNAFPNSSGQRKQLAVAIEGVRKFRNRLAHHDSLFNVDVPFEIRRVLELAEFIDTSAAKWLQQVSIAMDPYAQRPIAVADTAVVAAKDAWLLYQRCFAYVCQPGRFFRPVERIAFYVGSHIQADILRIQHRRDNVEWSLASADRLRASADPLDRKVARVIDESRGDDWTGGVYQVFLLTRPGDPVHRQLVAPLPHKAIGRGSAFTQRQRYVSLHALETSASTADL